MHFSEKIESLVPYKPGQSQKDVQEKYQRDFFVKLASNENSFPPSEKVYKAMEKALHSVHLYPDPACRDLIQVAAQYYDVAPESILVGNGSNELIDLLIRLTCEAGDKVLTSEGAFIAYKICAAVSRADVIEIPLKEGYKIDLEAFSAKLKSLEVLPKTVFIPNPNNPTGTFIPKSEVDAFLQEWGDNKEMVIVFDEAYTEFVSSENFPETKDLLKYKNVLVLKTLSKVFGLAGLRLGFLLGRPDFLSYIHRIRNPFNVNSIAQAAAAAVLQDRDSLQKSVNRVVEGRQDFAKFLESKKIKYAPSQANFILFDSKRDAVEINDEFLKEGLIVRPLLPYGFKTELRITIGSPEEMAFAKEVFNTVFQG